MYRNLSRIQTKRVTPTQNAGGGGYRAPATMNAPPPPLNYDVGLNAYRTPRPPNLSSMMTQSYTAGNPFTDGRVMGGQNVVSPQPQQSSNFLSGISDNPIFNNLSDKQRNDVMAQANRIDWNVQTPQAQQPQQDPFINYLEGMAQATQVPLGQPAQQFPQNTNWNQFQMNSNPFGVPPRQQISYNNPYAYNGYSMAPSPLPNYYNGGLGMNFGGGGGLNSMQSLQNNGNPMYDAVMSYLR